MTDKESMTKICSICGEHIGMYYNHAECSLMKKEIYGDSKENKKPKKKLSKKAVNDYGKYLSKL